MSKAPGLFSRLAAPLAKAARRVVGVRTQAEQEEVDRLMAEALAQADKGGSRLTDDTFQLFTEQLLKQEEGAFQTKLHIVSLVEFREAVGERWSKVSDKVMMIAEGVISMHLGAGNIFGRQGTDFFVLLFRTCDNAEARRRAVTIAQELGTRLVGDQFVGNERPLALAAELSPADGLHEDGSLDLDAVHAAVSEMRSLIAGEKAGSAPPPHAWMRTGAASAEGPQELRRHLRPGEALPEQPNEIRRHLQPGEPPPPPAPADDRPPIEVQPEPEDKGPGPDPAWKKLEIERAAKAKDPAWVALQREQAAKVAPELEQVVDHGTQPLPGDARLALVWRPTWVAAGETIGAYKARILRIDKESAPTLEGVNAYPRGDEPAAQTLDRFRIANAIRDFRASDAAGNGSTVIIPVHWLTLTADNRMEFLSPFADVTQQARGARIVIELFGAPADVKPILLGTVIQRAKELCREVAWRTRLADPRAAVALDCGAGMIGVDLAELVNAERTDDDHLLAALKTFHAQAAKARLGAYVWGVRRRKVIVGCVQGGFAMVNGPALMKDIPKPAKVLPAPKARFTAV